MKKFDLGQSLNTLANVGVIAGIIFLAYELNQNNEFLELEAKATRVQITLDGWERIASDPSTPIGWGTSSGESGNLKTSLDN